MGRWSWSSWQCCQTHSFSHYLGSPLCVQGSVAMAAVIWGEQRRDSGSCRSPYSRSLGEIGGTKVRLYLRRKSLLKTIKINTGGMLKGQRSWRSYGKEESLRNTELVVGAQWLGGNCLGGLSWRRQSLWSEASCMWWGPRHLLQPCLAIAEKVAEALKKGRGQDWNSLCRCFGMRMGL